MSTDNRLPVGICVPTIREDQISEFLKRWGPFWSFYEQEAYDVTLFIHEDNPAKHFKLPKLPGLKIVHTCHVDIAPTLGEAEWIIPRGSGASRSFPMFLSWQHGCEYILTLDDDCYPIDHEAVTFLNTHLAAFHHDRWFHTISGIEPRGVPYGNRGHLPVLLNHGLWTGVPDLDAPRSLAASRNGTKVILRADREVIPPGMWFTLCAMNVCYCRNVIPAAYNLLMGLDTIGFDRFDDIWSGLLIKRIADHLGFYVTNGVPFVHHTKASDPFKNLQKEAAGLEIHEYFWRYMASAPLRTEATISDCYRSLAAWICKFPIKEVRMKKYTEYFSKLSEAMLCWLRLFSDS